MRVANIFLSLALLGALPLMAQKSSTQRSKGKAGNLELEVARSSTRSRFCDKLDALLKDPDSDVYDVDKYAKGWECDAASGAAGADEAKVRATRIVPDEFVIERETIALFTCYDKFTPAMRSILCEQMVACEPGLFETSKYFCYTDTAVKLEKANREYQALGKDLPRPKASPKKR